MAKDNKKILSSLEFFSNMSSDSFGDDVMNTEVLFPSKKINARDNKEEDISPIRMEEDDRPRKKKKKDSMQEMLGKVSSYIENKDVAVDKYDFDSYIDGAVEDDEDAELRNGLIAQGRAYAREHAISENESEVTKAFAPQEKSIHGLIKELETDKKSLQEDISKLRSVKVGGNRKMLAELVSAKNAMHNTQLSAIKELNSINKTKFDIKAKAEKDKNEAGSEYLSPFSVQEIIGGNFNNIVSSVGGRTASSGAIQYDYEEGVDFEVSDVSNSDEVIQKKYFSNDEDESDGDLFLKYENIDVQFILLVDSDENPIEILCEDPDGNLIPDYPKPDDIDDLLLKYDFTVGVATDKYSRRYTIRQV